MACIKSAMYTKKKSMGENPGAPENNKLPAISQDTFTTLDAAVQQNCLSRDLIVRSPFANRGTIGKLIALINLPRYIFSLCKTLIDQQNTFNASIARSINLLRDISVYNDHNIQELRPLQGSRSIMGEIRFELNVLQNKVCDIERSLEKSKQSYCIHENDRTGPALDDSVANYFSLKPKFQGSREEIKDEQKGNVKYFKGKRLVLDAGCGYGEFLELLVDNGIGAIGVDIDDDMVNTCRERGLPAIKCDPMEYLSSREDGSLDGVFADQVIEYLKPAGFIDFIKLSHAKLRTSGTLVIETINPNRPWDDSKGFVPDKHHVKPIHPSTVYFLLESVAFKEILFEHPDPVSTMGIMRIIGVK